jgi:hypothetical protein
VVKLHRSIVTVVPAMGAFAAQICNSLFLFLDPPMLAVIIEADFAE